MEANNNYAPEQDNQNAPKGNELGNVAETTPQVINNDDVAMLIEEAVAAPTEEERERMELMESIMQNRVKPDDDIPEPENIIQIEGHACVTKGELTSLKAKHKTGKTTALTIVCAAALGCDDFKIKASRKDNRILYVDTEQSRYSTQKIVKRARAMSGLSAEEFDERFFLLYQREQYYETRIQQLRTLLGELHFDMVVIDNIADLTGDFNNHDSSKAVVDELLSLASQYDCAIITNQHENKHTDDQNSQGFLGSFQDKRATLLWQCKKTDGIFSVVCVGSRNEEVPTWSFCFDESGNIHDAEKESQALFDKKQEEKSQRRLEKQQKTEEERWKKTREVMLRNGCMLNRAMLVQKLMEVLNLGYSATSKFVSAKVTEGKLHFDGKLITMETGR